MAFSDTDESVGQIGGVVTWTPPSDEALARVTEYKIYLANDATGACATGG